MLPLPPCCAQRAAGGGALEYRLPNPHTRRIVVPFGCRFPGRKPAELQAGLYQAIPLWLHTSTPTARFNSTSRWSAGPRGEARTFFRWYTYSIVLDSESARLCSAQLETPRDAAIIFYRFHRPGRQRNWHCLGNSDARKFAGGACFCVSGSIEARRPNRRIPIC